MGKIHQDCLNELIDQGYCTEEECSPEENEKYLNIYKEGNLPHNIRIRYADSGKYLFSKFHVDTEDEEVIKLQILKQTKMINTIKKCAVFFATILAIELIAQLILLIFVLTT